ncbi:hypothetical protein M6B38_134965 [Iris pallida]|uniref:Uncharacterized protein n=1 Tax=Iris pallida TaxID=29817 RepID=A0AAX6FGK8_IRIPA|nr:hypothetical protein M6B38_134965 [Iris pallida]
MVVLGSSAKRRNSGDGGCTELEETAPLPRRHRGLREQLCSRDDDVLHEEAVARSTSWWCGSDDDGVVFETDTAVEETWHYAAELRSSWWLGGVGSPAMYDREFSE